MTEAESRRTDKDAERRVLTNTLEKLMDDIYDAVGVRVTFSDQEGTLLVESGYQCDFCQASLQRAGSRCHECAREAARRAGERDGVFFYRCWRGLMSALLQVRVNEAVLGNFVISGYVCSPERMAETEQLFPDPAVQITPEEMTQVRFLQYEHVRDIIRTVSIAAKYLSEAVLRHQAETAQRQAEFRALQSQISPHFLFNTLNSISQMAVLEGAEQTPEAIYSLAVLLRRTMKQNTGQVPLKEELRFVGEYIRIKQLLGHEDIRYIEETAPNVEDVQIPAFTVQPLVENAVKHGLEPRGTGGTVGVSVYREADRLVIAVTDDGVGFENDVGSEAGGEMSGIGFANVIERLQLFYGGSFEYEVISRPGDGTTVTLRMPVME